MSSEQKFIKGFNAGYLLAKHNPKLSWTLQQSLKENENPLALGFVEGAIEHGREKLREETNAQSQKRQNHNRDR